MVAAEQSGVGNDTRPDGCWPGGGGGSCCVALIVIGFIPLHGCPHCTLLRRRSRIVSFAVRILCSPLLIISITLLQVSVSGRTHRIAI